MVHFASAVGSRAYRSYVRTRRGPRHQRLNSTDIFRMNQLVRQMKVWDLRADARDPIASEGLEFDATGGDGGLCDAPELIVDLETSGSSSGSVSPDVEMHDTSDPVVIPPTLSHIFPQSDIHHDGPMVVDDDVSPSVDASYALATLADTASVSSSLLSIIKRQKSDAMELDRASTNDVTFDQGLSHHQFPQ